MPTEAQKRAGAHNYALRQVVGAKRALQQQLAECHSLTPLARLRIENAIAELSAAEKNIRSFRIEPFGSIREFSA